jgi:sugar/nucleoside kinase (ribokinase family)
MDHRTRTLKELQTHRSHITTKNAVLGFDGFIDKIMHVVDRRSGPGAHFHRLTRMEDFAHRIADAAGRSTNVELYPIMEKLGGNGPIMGDALLAAGVKTRYIGALGKPTIHPVFTDFARKTDAVSICEPGRTHAIEFEDGKIMLGDMASLDEITMEAVVNAMGEGAFLDLLSRADLISLVNWTMIPHMTALLSNLLDRILPILPPRDQRIFFFDLADPEKRSVGDLQTALRTISRFHPFGYVTLGLNLKEAIQVAGALDLPEPKVDQDGLKALASRIRQALQIGTVVVHPIDSAACATRGDSWWIPGPFTENPKITTGAGDHFNAGFVIGQLLKLSPEACLTMGAYLSAYYVHTAKSPTLNDVDVCIREWHTWE